MIEQAIYTTEGREGYRFLAQSPGFREEWRPEAERLCTGFGERPADVVCPECVFARPFGPRHVAVVQAADQGFDAAGRPGALGFRLLIVPRPLYRGAGADPFLFADAFPPPWHVRGELPTLEWTGTPPRRTVEALRQVLDVPYSATLLGGAQALLDGGRVVFERREPEPRLVRGLWALLPTAARAELWPASFAFGNAHGFDAVVVPRAVEGEFPGYLHEEQAGDYPEGRYELRLQTAVEAGDQDDVDALLSRRGRGQTLRLGFLLLAVMVLGPVAVNLLIPTPPAPKAPTGKTAPNLPRPQDCPPLPDWERRALADHLTADAKRLGLAPPKGMSDADLTEALAALDAKLGTPDRSRDPGPLRDLGPLQRQLRALLWKHGVAGYDAAGPNTVELLEKLGEKLRH